MALNLPPVSFAFRVVAELEAGKHHRAFKDHKPSHDSMLFSDDFDARYGNDDSCWSLSYRLGLFFYHICLSRNNVENIPLTRAEKRALSKAFDAAIAAEKIKYRERRERARL